jgi:hypothetical protein
MFNKFHSRSFKTIHSSARLFCGRFIWRCLDNVRISRFTDISLRVSGLRVVRMIMMLVKLFATPRSGRSSHILVLILLTKRAKLLSLGEI